VLLRYADVLLLKAEAINEISGPTPEAYAAINAVRARASRSATQIYPPLTPGLSAAQFRDSVFLERRYELALEMHGLFDSRRNWPWYMKRIGESMTSISTKNASPFTSSTTKFDARVGGVLPDKWKLYAIPAGACELNHLLVQNPGWPADVCDGQ